MRASPFASVRFQAFAPLAVRPRYHRARAVGVVASALSGYCAVVLLGLSVDQMVAPLTGIPLESTTVACSHRMKSTFPPAAVARHAGTRSAFAAGPCSRSIVTLSRYAFVVPSIRLWL